ncbi:hypothetical protein Q2T42_30505 [Leptolyngbya boryana CZ1]|uniref:Ribbon-helix-helix protein CopG domain-containing protein n=1 Tax=Leptolyngbya boryana CZ1 TaxID=3060204 RepID=A0AA96WVK4_LEPBY|nr:hypothetical protein [Leptolyngbya boryana]WNZ46123.1 hypothetical protein Q2T42_30505 [Leptolyngbya boryana CZ1]
MAKRGQKSLRGQPEFYEEVKLRTSIALTPTARQGLDELAHSFGLSRSEFVERIGRNLISVQRIDPSTNT